MNTIGRIKNHPAVIGRVTNWRAIDWWRSRIMTNEQMINELRGMAAQILSPKSKGKAFFNAVADKLEDQETRGALTLMLWIQSDKGRRIGQDACGEFWAMDKQLAQTLSAPNIPHLFGKMEAAGWFDPPHDGAEPTHVPIRDVAK